MTPPVDFSTAGATRPLADLVADPRNPRAITAAARAGLGASMHSFGDIAGIVWNRRTGQLVAGHQRVAQLAAAGATAWTEAGPGAGYIEHPATGERFPLRIVDWGPAEQTAANLAANNPEIAGHFTAALPALLDEVRRGLPELYAKLRLDALSLLAPRGALAAEVALPEAPTEPVTRTGDLWTLGAHRILCGDSTKAEDVARVMAGERAVLMATDPPYGVAYDNAERPNPGVAKPRVAKPRVAKPRVANDEHTGGPAMQAFLESMLRAAAPTMAETAAYYFWHPMLTQGTYVAAAAAAAGILIHRQIIWVKPGLLLGRGDYHWRHELCFYGWRRGARCPFYGPRNQDTIWEIGSVSVAEREEFGHATPKPVELWRAPIENHARAGEVCYEPFSGSGTQIIAAEQLGRRCFALEIAPQYCDVAVERYQRLTRTPAILDGDGRPFADVARARGVAAP